MKLIIAGGRTFNDYDGLLEVINELIEEGSIPEEGLEIVSGMAIGADSLGIQLAEDNDLVLHEFPANWDKHGNFAGYKRNMDMGRFADVLIAFWNGESKGTKHMIEYMKSLKKPVFVYMYED